MLAEESLREGNLEETLARLQGEVRKNPAEPKHRIFLFQLLSVLGDWDRALNQLNVAGDLDDGALAMVQTYREALRCEALRAEVFAGRRSPLLFGEPAEWMALMVEALRLTAEGEYAKSQEVRERAFEAAPATSGAVDDEPFEWIADADSRLGPILEAIVNGRYYWIPFQRIRTIRVEEPADLRDLVWTPVQFTWANGGETVGLVPTRYPESHASGDSLVRLGRKTEWEEREGELYLGLGQRMLATDAGEYPLLDIRLIGLDTEAETGATAGPGAEGGTENAQATDG